MKKLVLIILLLAAAGARAEDRPLSDLQTLITDGWAEQATVLLNAQVTGKHPAPTALYLKARAEFSLNHLEEAQDWAEKSVKAAPDSSRFWGQLGNIKAMRVRQSPLKGMTLGRSSRKDIEKAIKLDPRNVEALQSLMYFRLYAPGIVGGDQDKAAEMAEQIAAIDPAQGHLVRAQLYQRQDGNLDRALPEMRAAAAVDSLNPGLCYDLGRSLLAQSHPDEALEFLEEGRRRDPDPTAGLLKLGNAYLRLGLYPEARSAYRQVQTIDPANPAAAVGLAVLLSAQGQPDQALAAFRALDQAHPDYPPARYYLAAALIEQQQDPAQARALLEDYLAGAINQQWPSRALASWKLALALEKLGRYNQAWEAISLALDLSGGNEAMKSDAKRLEFMGKD